MAPAGPARQLLSHHRGPCDRCDLSQDRDQHGRPVCGAQTPGTKGRDSEVKTWAAAPPPIPDFWPPGRETMNECTAPRCLLRGRLPRYALARYRWHGPPGSPRATVRNTKGPRARAGRARPTSPWAVTVTPASPPERQGSSRGNSAITPADE